MKIEIDFTDDELIQIIEAGCPEVDFLFSDGCEIPAARPWEREGADMNDKCPTCLDTLGTGITCQGCMAIRCERNQPDVETLALQERLRQNPPLDYGIGTLIPTNDQRISIGPRDY